MLCKRSDQNLKLKLQNDEGTYMDSEVDTGMDFCSDAESRFAIGICIIRIHCFCHWLISTASQDQSVIFDFHLEQLPICCIFVRFNGFKHFSLSQLDFLLNLIDQMEQLNLLFPQIRKWPIPDNTIQGIKIKFSLKRTA